MKRWMNFCRDSRVRLICMILFTVSVVTTVGSFQWFCNYMNDTGQSPGVIFENYNQSYTETSGFQSGFVSTSEQIMNSVLAKDLFETKGKFDGGRIVDLKQYYNEGTIDGTTDCGVSFTVDDLLKLGAEFNNDTYNYENIYVCQKHKVGDDGLAYVYMRESEMDQLLGEYDYDDGIYSDGERSIYDNDGNLLYDDFWTLELPETDISPQEGEWLDIFNTNPKLNGAMSDYGDMLTAVSSSIYSLYMQYQESDSYADAGKTNVRYMMYNESSKTLYSNNPDWNDPKKYKTYMKEIQQQDIYMSNEGSSWSNNFINSATSSIYDELIYERNSSYGEDVWYMGFTIDTSFSSAEDIFYTQDLLYSQYSADAEILKTVLAASVAVLVISLIMLTFGLGVSKGGVIDLFTFDKLKTEIAALIIVAVWGIFFGTGVCMIGEFRELMGSYIFWAAMLSIPSAILFLIGYASFLKRIRAHTLWKNSLCHTLWMWIKKLFIKLFGFLREVYQNLPLLWKTGAIMGVFIILHWLAMADDSGFFIFVALIVEAAAVIAVIRRAINEQKIMDGLRAIVNGKLEQKIDTGKMKGSQKEKAELLNHVEDGLEEAIEKQMKSERMKTELITNVSHDIKTPLTSIINYVDLLKRETAQLDTADPKKVEEYLEILDQKSQRLKTLTEDVVEASKISSGNIVLENTKLDLVETLLQIEGEYSEKLSAAGLTLVKRMPDPPVTIFADGRRVWRVFGNLYQNAAKYAMPNTRVYVELTKENGKAIFTMKNISEAPLNIDADELTERFIRGDESRTTEGSGLGLSIAKSLTETMKGRFEIYLDGDLFKVTVEFPISI